MKPIFTPDVRSGLQGKPRLHVLLQIKQQLKTQSADLKNSVYSLFCHPEPPRTTIRGSGSIPLFNGHDVRMDSGSVAQASHKATPDTAGMTKKVIVAKEECVTGTIKTHGVVFKNGIIFKKSVVLPICHPGRRAGIHASDSRLTLWCPEVASKSLSPRTLIRGSLLALHGLPRRSHEGRRLGVPNDFKVKALSGLFGEKNEKIESILNLCLLNNKTVFNVL